jgi:ParB-like chromosome segregation protein Spo0J
MPDKAFKQAEVHIHPSANIFPMLEGAELKQLSDSIKLHGLREKIVVTREGVLIDGRNRLAAMTLAEIMLKPEHVTVMDFDESAFSIDEYIVMANIERRNLTRQQRKELAGRLAVKFEKEQEHLPKASKKDSTEKAATVAGVSRRTAAEAKQEAFVEMGLRPPPTPQNESTAGKKKGKAKADQAPARPPAVIKSLTGNVEAIKATAQKWPDARKKQAVELAMVILSAFATTTHEVGLTDHLKGLLGVTFKKELAAVPDAENEENGDEA